MTWGGEAAWSLGWSFPKRWLDLCSPSRQRAGPERQRCPQSSACGGAGGSIAEGKRTDSEPPDWLRTPLHFWVWV